MSDFGALAATIWAAVLLVSIGCVLLLAERAGRRLLANRRERLDLYGPVRTRPRTETAVPSSHVRSAPAGAHDSPPVPPPNPQAARPTPGVRRLGPTSVDAVEGAASTDSHNDAS